MSKQQMIEQIRRHNRSAAGEFLVHFNEQALESYLRRLSLVSRRGRDSAWVREGHSRAIVTRVAA